MNNVKLIGVCGGSASGKSRLSHELCAVFSSESTLVLQDDYYNDSRLLSKKEKANKNYDHPNAIELDRLYENLKNLKAGRSVDAPVYCFKSHSRLAEPRRINPTQIIIVDGLFVFERPELRSLFDLKIYLSVESDIRLIRRIYRDVQERGRTLDSVLTQYLSTVRPMHDKFVEPASKYADLIIPSVTDKDIAHAVEELTRSINTLLEGSDREQRC